MLQNYFCAPPPPPQKKKKKKKTFCPYESTLLHYPFCFKYLEWRHSYACLQLTISAPILLTTEGFAAMLTFQPSLKLKL